MSNSAYYRNYLLYNNIHNIYLQKGGGNVTLIPDTS